MTTKTAKDLHDLAIAAGWTEQEFAQELTDTMVTTLGIGLEEATGKGADRYRLEFYDEDGYAMVVNVHREPIVNASGITH